MPCMMPCINARQYAQSLKSTRGIPVVITLNRNDSRNTPRRVDQLTAGQCETPQVLVLQEAAELAPNESKPAPELFEANVEIFLAIF
jgi:hypothetical protein